MRWGGGSSLLHASASDWVRVRSLAQGICPPTGICPPMLWSPFPGKPCKAFPCRTCECVGRDRARGQCVICDCVFVSPGLYVTVSVWNRGRGGTWGIFGDCCVCELTLGIMYMSVIHFPLSRLDWAGLDWAVLGWAGSSCVCSEARLRAVLNTLQPP